MEAKNLRPNLALLDAKSNKPDTNLPVGKIPNRNGKKRESGGNGGPSSWTVSSGASSSSNSPSSMGIKGQQQKAFWPKQKGSDKQQRSKVGSKTTGTQGKNDNQVTDCADLDLDYWITEGGKKQNLAHMLNMKFQLAPRDTLGSPYWRANHSSGVGDKGRRLYNHSYRGHTNLNKDHYLQANCQFVVKADGDYTVYLSDPDLLVPWESIEQIRIWDSEVGSCPICLHPPVAARMTRCGHVYCWPCILHFLALSDKTSRPCPICDAAVRIQDLKSVVALEQQKWKIGDILEMKLMKRERHSLEPEPVSHLKPKLGFHQPMNLAGAGERQVYSKLLLCKPEDVVKLILMEEKRELELQLEVEKDCPESCFIQQALELLKDRETTSVAQFSETVESLHGLSLDDGNPGGACGAIDNVADMDSDSNLPGCNRFRYESVSSDGQADCSSALSVEESESMVAGALLHPTSSSPISLARNSPAMKQQKNIFYFYQSCDGQAIFLHPINVQMLTECYGSLEFCPDTIQGRIVEIDTMSMTPELRNRLRYLGHIPISKQFQIMEITLSEPTVDSTVLELFRERIEERERRRHRKDRDERRRDLEIQRAEEAKWGRNKHQPVMQLDSQIHFPEFSSNQEADPPLPSSTTCEAESLDYSQQHGPSFAQMLREGTNKIPSGFPSKSSKRTGISGDQHYNASYHDDNDYVSAPTYKDSFNSALSAALDQAGNSIGKEKDVDQRNGKKGKKKPKQKVLFSTGMNFV